MGTIVIGSRASRLALYQAHLVKSYLEGEDSSLHIEIATIATLADKAPEDDIAAMGGKGAFVKEIEDALLAGSVDIAVHSLKDLPAELPEGLELSCYLPRTDPRDVLLSRNGHTLEGLHYGAVVGTSSPRRAAWAKHMRPDLKIVPFRGNLETRIRKLIEGKADATFLAAAGLRRLGMWEQYGGMIQPIPKTDCIPAVGQGIIAIESRVGDERLKELLATVNCYESAVTARCEREFLAQFGMGSCNRPLGAYCEFAGNKKIILYAFSASEDGRYYIRYTDSALPSEPRLLGKRVGRILKEATASTINVHDACLPLDSAASR
jgi:hydroxymethylbilane synthase